MAEYEVHGLPEDVCFWEKTGDPEVPGLTPACNVDLVHVLTTID